MQIDTTGYCRNGKHSVPILERARRKYGAKLYEGPAKPKVFGALRVPGGPLALSEDCSSADDFRYRTDTDLPGNADPAQSLTREELDGDRARLQVCLDGVAVEGEQERPIVFDNFQPIYDAPLQSITGGPWRGRVDAELEKTIQRMTERVGIDSSTQLVTSFDILFP